MATPIVLADQTSRVQLASDQKTRQQAPTSNRSACDQRPAHSGSERVTYWTHKQAKLVARLAFDARDAANPNAETNQKRAKFQRMSLRDHIELSRRYCVAIGQPAAAVGFTVQKPYRLIDYGQRSRLLYTITVAGITHVHTYRRKGKTSPVLWLAIDRNTERVFAECTTYFEAACAAYNLTHGIDSSQHHPHLGTREQIINMQTQRPTRFYVAKLLRKD